MRKRVIEIELWQPTATVVNGAVKIYSRDSHCERSLWRKVTWSPDGLNVLLWAIFAFSHPYFADYFIIFGKVSSQLCPWEMECLSTKFAKLKIKMMIFTIYIPRWILLANRIYSGINNNNYNDFNKHVKVFLKKINLVSGEWWVVNRQKNIHHSP